MSNVYGQMKRRIKRSMILTDHIDDHLREVWGEYKDDFPEFAERVVNLSKFNTEFRKALLEVAQQLGELGR